MVDQVFPARSEKVNVKLPFPVKVCQVKFIFVRLSEYQVSVAMTFEFVAQVGEYDTVAVGGIMSIFPRDTVISLVSFSLSLTLMVQLSLPT